MPTGFVNVSVPMHLAKGENTIRLHVPEAAIGYAIYGVEQL